MMEKNFNSDGLGHLQANTERDFLAALLNVDNIQSAWQPGEALSEDMMRVAELPEATATYPWNPAAPEAEAFFAQSERISIFDGIEAELPSRANRFFAQLDQRWGTVSLEATLAQRFASRVPQSLLAAIAQSAQAALSQAQGAVASSLSAADQLAAQLVGCVEGVMPSLATEDLFVIARPLAYQMRNGEQCVDAAIAQVPTTEWENLSDVQKARLSLAIARCAIDELQA
jgi:hypothetical protein